MASLGDVSRFLRQRRAIGKPITAEDRRAAWGAYYDTQATKTLERSRLATQRDQFNQQMGFKKEQAAITNARLQEQQEAADKAATISGITEIGKLGFMASKTDLGKDVIGGAKDFLGIGKTSTAVGAQTPAISSLTPTTTMGVQGAAIPQADAAVMGSTTGASTAPSVTPSLTSQALSVAGPAIGGFGAGEFARGKTMESKTIQSGIEKATFGLAHAKKDAARISGATAGAAAGFVVGGPPGAVIGGLIGGVGKEGADWLIDANVKVGKEIGGFVKSGFDKVASFFGF